MYDSMSEAMGVQLGTSVEHMEEVDTEEDGVGWGQYLRVKICLDISKPLARGRVLKLYGQTTWVAFQYERLSKFCFQCGIIRHGAAGCLNKKGGRSKSVRNYEGAVWFLAPSISNV